MGSSLQVCVLGGLSLAMDGRVVRCKRSAATDLLALLALEPTHRLTRDDVAGRLWPAASAREASKALERAVRDLRRLLHDDRAVTLDGDNVRLWPHGSLTVDVHLFLASAKHAHNDEQRVAAAARYRGEVLEGYGERPWADRIRARATLAYLTLEHALYGNDPDEVDLTEALAQSAYDERAGRSLPAAKAAP